MAENTVTIACPVCSTGNSTTTTRTDTDTTTTTTSGVATPPGSSADPKVEHANGVSTAIANASSTGIQHTYDVTGYHIPIQVEGFRKLLPPHMPVAVEAIKRENQALGAHVLPDRAIHGIHVEGLTRRRARRIPHADAKKASLE